MYYEDSPKVKKIIEIGRSMITLAEKNEVFADDDELWNACVCAGNKLTTFGTTWGLQSIKELKRIEQKALLKFLER